MAPAVQLLTLPFRAAWSLGKLLFLPVVIVAGAALVGAGSTWFVVVVLVCGLWALALARLWWLELRGVLRSLARGTVHVSRLGGVRRGVGRRSRGGGRR